MIEMLGVLAIIGVLSAGGIMGYSVAMEEHKANKFATDMSTIATNMVNVLGNAKNMGGNIGGAALCQAKIIPDEYCKTLNTTNIERFKHLWGGKMDIQARADSNGSFVFYMWARLAPYKDGVSQKACVKLATMKWTGFKRVLVWVYHDASIVTALSAPVSTTLAKQWCYDTKGSESRINVMFYF